MKTRVTVVDSNDVEHYYTGEEVGFSADANLFLIIHEPSKEDKDAARKTIAVFKNWENVHIENA